MCQCYKHFIFCYYNIFKPINIVKKVKNTPTLTHRHKTYIITSSHGSGVTRTVVYCYLFLFLIGFLTPRLTRYTEAARIAPSAKAASGVPTSAKIMGIPSPQKSCCFSACAFHNTKHRKRNNKSC